jgi:hypothetical protein
MVRRISGSGRRLAAKEMNDQQDYADNEKNVNKSSGNVERYPGDEPNAKE